MSRTAMATWSISVNTVAGYRRHSRRGPAGASVGTRHYDRRFVREVAVPGSVIVSSARTPVGKLSGSLSTLAATDLGAHAIRAALERGDVGPEQVDYVIMGQVIQAGAGQSPARQAAAAAGIPLTTPANTINKVCLSGLDAVYLADQM